MREAPLVDSHCRPGRRGEADREAHRQSGIAVLGKDDASAWWAAGVQAGDVFLPATISRPEIGELCAAEALTVDGGRLTWKPIEARQNHRGGTVRSSPSTVATSRRGPRPAGRSGW